MSFKENKSLNGVNHLPNNIELLTTEVGFKHMWFDIRSQCISGIPKFLPCRCTSRLNEVMHIKHLGQCLAIGKHSVNVNNY